MEADLEKKRGSRLGADKVNMKKEKLEVNRLAKLAENVRGAAEKISTIKKVLDPAVEI